MFFFIFLTFPSFHCITIFIANFIVTPFSWVLLMCQINQIFLCVVESYILQLCVHGRPTSVLIINPYQIFQYRWKKKNKRLKDCPGLRKTKCTWQLNAHVTVDGIGIHIFARTSDDFGSRLPVFTFFFPHPLAQGRILRKFHFWIIFGFPFRSLLFVLFCFLFLWDYRYFTPAIIVLRGVGFISLFVEIHLSKSFSKRV